MPSWFELEVVDEHVEPPPVAGDRGGSWFVIDVTNEHVEPPPPTEEPPPSPAFGLPSFLGKRRRRKAEAKLDFRTLRFTSTTPLPTTNVAIRALVPTQSATPLPRALLVVHTGQRRVALVGAITSRAGVHAEVSRISSTPLPQVAITISKRDVLDDGEELAIILSLL